MIALGRANEIRTTRAVWKVDVKKGRVDPRIVISEPPPEFETMRVFDALLAMPKVGRVKANTLLRLNRISASKTIGGLSVRQRMELLSMLRPYTAVVRRSRTLRP